MPFIEAMILIAGAFVAGLYAHKYMPRKCRGCGKYHPGRDPVHDPRDGDPVRFDVRIMERVEEEGANRRNVIVVQVGMYAFELPTLDAFSLSRRLADFVVRTATEEETQQIAADAKQRLQEVLKRTGMNPVASLQEALDNEKERT